MPEPRRNNPFVARPTQPLVILLPVRRPFPRLGKQHETMQPDYFGTKLARKSKHDPGVAARWAQDQVSSTRSHRYPTMISRWLSILCMDASYFEVQIRPCWDSGLWDALVSPRLFVVLPGSPRAWLPAPCLPVQLQFRRHGHTWHHQPCTGTGRDSRRPGKGHR